VKSDYPNFSVVVVDNDSRLDHVEKIKNEIFKLGENISLLESKVNLGYSGGNNLGIKFGLQNGADFIFILNNDAIAPAETLSRLVSEIEQDELIGIIGPALNEGNLISYGGKISWLKPELIHLHQQPTINNQLSTINYYIPGAAMLLSKKLLEKIGFLDEKYFLYFEDADFSMRAKKAGFKLKIVPDVKIFHAVSSATRRLGSPLLFRYHFRNSLLFNWKFGPIWVKMIMPFWSLLIIFKQVAKMVFLPSKKGVSKYILLGVIDFYRNRFGEIK